MAATKASEHLDLAAAIVNIAKAKAAASKKEKNEAAVRMKADSNKTRDAVVRKTKPAKKRSKKPAMVAAPQGSGKQSKETRPAPRVKFSRGDLWKPLHRRSGRALF
jgi:hypothetical protein